MLCALIMAGGKGTRFWPLSTEKKPKQFLNLLGQDTMIQMAVKRLLPIIPMERIFVVTSKEYVPILKEQLPNINNENIIVEPIGRNTAPCIALSAFHINKRYKDATMIVVPSDHLIKKEDEFLIPYKVVNGKNDTLKGVKATSIKLFSKSKSFEIKEGIIAFCNTNLSKSGEYKALLSRGIL